MTNLNTTSRCKIVDIVYIFLYLNISHSAAMRAQFICAHYNAYSPSFPSTTFSSELSADQYHCIVVISISKAFLEQQHFQLIHNHNYVQ